MKIVTNGLITGLLLQLAIGPIFFFIINLSLQKTIIDGFVAVFAVTIVDYFYISLALFGVGKLLNNNRFRKMFGLCSSIILILFGIFLIRNLSAFKDSTELYVHTSSLVSSFTSSFILGLSSPMSIVFWTSFFASKALEFNYAKKELIIYGFSTGLATILFMGSSVILFSIIKGSIPIFLIQISNTIVGLILIGYGGVMGIKMLGNK